MSALFPHESKVREAVAKEIGKPVHLKKMQNSQNKILNFEGVARVSASCPCKFVQFQYDTADETHECMVTVELKRNSDLDFVTNVICRESQ